MELLHTSDWHLGQTLHQHEREAEHARFLAWLLNTLQAEQIDALLVAGDVFDNTNTNPSAASQARLHFLVSADLWENHAWLGSLIRTTDQALPAPKPDARSAPANGSGAKK